MVSLARRADCILWIPGPSTGRGIEKVVAMKDSNNGVRAVIFADGKLVVVFAGWYESTTFQMDDIVKELESTCR